ncbi:MAG: four helix bundle protein [Verrucomicrobiota bacterium]
MSEADDFFENLPLWRTSHEMALSVYAILEAEPFLSRPGLRHEIEMRTLQVTGQIAESTAHGGYDDMLRHLHAARGGGHALVSLLKMVAHLPGASEMDDALQTATGHAQACSGELKEWIGRLQQEQARQMAPQSSNVSIPPPSR